MALLAPAAQETSASDLPRQPSAADDFVPAYVPFASSPAVRARMQGQARRDTAPELAIRRALHRQGLRYRVDVRPDASIRRRADVVFPRQRVAVFVDGCFWHGCLDHGVWPRTNQAWWREKIERNKRRDLETTRLLEDRGWTVLRVWEHDDPEVVASTTRSIVEARRTAAGS